jgi:CHAT domain-containing protein
LRLVFLSACRTAYTADTDLLDEAIHLTSAFLLVGARHVIGTLWEVHDATAPEMAASFYRGLRTAAGKLDTDRAAPALHDAVREVRDRYPHMPYLWAGYLHVGA